MSAAPTGGATEGIVSGTGSSISLTFTLPNAPDCGVVSLTYDAATAVTVTACTFAGATCTSVGRSADNTRVANAVQHNFAEQFTRPAPASSATLSVTFSAAATDWYAFIAGASGVNQATPALAGSYVGSGASDTTDGSAHYSRTITSAAGGLTVSCTMGTEDSSLVGSATQTVDDIDAGGTNNSGVDHEASPFGGLSVIHEWIHNALQVNAGCVFSGFALNGGSGGPAAPGDAYMTPSFPRGRGVIRRRV